jgi:hypothetical protein
MDIALEERSEGNLGIRPGLIRAKYLLRLKGYGESCFLGTCTDQVTGALVDDAANQAMGVCTRHTDKQAAAEEGLRYVDFTDPVVLMVSKDGYFASWAKLLFLKRSRHESY